MFEPWQWHLSFELILRDAEPLNPKADAGAAPTSVRGKPPGPRMSPSQFSADESAVISGSDLSP
jgi:hypothetical protein